MRPFAIISLLLLLFLSSCREDVRITETTETTPTPNLETYDPPVENVTASLVGFIVDENNAPVMDAAVSFNNTTLTTDEYGHFFIDNATMNALGALVQVQKEGYFAGSRRFFPIEGEQSRIKIQLLEKTFDQFFAAESGGVIPFSNGASVEFSPNSIQTADGNAYTGMVNVAAQWLAPSQPTTIDQMPGNLQGVNAAAEQVALGTYGMIAVELEGEAGEPLNIADNKTATITMPVPPEMLSGAPSEIPLWSYHEVLGVWVQETKASLQGSSYVGAVSHFSFWNCDLPFDYVNLEMTLIDESDIPLNNYLVILSLEDSNGGIISSGSGYSDQNGNISGFIPANEILTMAIFDACGGVLSSQNIGPFAADTDLGSVIVSGINLNTTTITGTLLDCEGAPVTDGLVIAQFQGQTVYHYTSTSTFSMAFSTCANTSTIDVTGRNLTDLEQSEALTAIPNTTNDMGVINACGVQVQNFLSLNIDGETGIFENIMVFTHSGNTYFSSEGIEVDYMVFNFEGTTIGDYTNSAQIEVINHASLNWTYFDEDIEFTSFEVTQYDTVIIGSFTGSITNGGETVPMAGNFNVAL